jgi:hypothetical protein
MGFPPSGRADVQKEARERAMNKIEERAMKGKLAMEEASLKSQKAEIIKENRKRKEEERLKEIRDKKLDMWDLRCGGHKSTSLRRSLIPPPWVPTGIRASAGCRPGSTRARRPRRGWT